jgi:hypothetical protein
MLLRLGIEEDAADDLVFEEEEDAPKEGIKWMALARVHTDNFFSPQTFEQHMRFAWSPAKEVIFHALEENLFTIQCSCLGDWMKVEEEGPWLFRQHAVIIEKYDGLSSTDAIDLNFIAVWIQIHKLPVGYRKDPLITNLTEKKIGKVIKVEKDIPGVCNFVRVRVKIDVRKPLGRFVSLSRAGKREIYQVKYEKVPKFCGVCGMLGHSHLECGTGEHDTEKMQWGDWLKADWDTWRGKGIRGGRTGTRGGRRAPMDPGPMRGNFGGRGFAGRQQSWRFNALPPRGEEELVDPELQDTGSSPVKNPDVNMDDYDSTEPSVKRRLALEYVDRETNSDGNLDDMITNDESPRKSAENDDKTERIKRSKKAGASSPSLGSAGSLGEPVRSQ